MNIQNLKIEWRNRNEVPRDLPTYCLECREVYKGEEVFYGKEAEENSEAVLFQNKYIKNNDFEKAYAYQAKTCPNCLKDENNDNVFLQYDGKLVLGLLDDDMYMCELADEIAKERHTEEFFKWGRIKWE